MHCRHFIAIFLSSLLLPRAAVPQAMLDEVLVTTPPLGRTLFEQAQPASLLAGERLRLRIEPTLGETLSHEPGLAATGFAPAASRPVIRGLSEDRVRVLQDGVSTQDVANVSPDHAVSIDPLSIETVEVVRGPAALLYGPNTVGGVVNAIGNRVPDRRVAAESSGLPLRGRFDLRAGSVDEERSAGGLLEFGVGPLQFHLDGFTRETQDFHIPGHARSERRRAREPLGDGEKEVRDVLPNSFSRSEGGAIGASYVWESGYVGAAYSGRQSRYGVVAEPDVTIDLEQRRWDVRGGWREPARGIRELRFKLGFTDYAHTEFEGAEVGTVFDQQAFEGRFEVLHERIGPLEGTIGFQTQSIDFSALGAEAFLPQVDTRVHSLFLFEEARIGERWRVQMGARYDRQTNDSDTASGFTGLDREFDAFSGSLGAVFTPDETWAVALTASCTQRPPTYVELFADGAHVATDAFEVGDAGLGLEESFALDLTVRKKQGRVTGAASAFFYRFADFITLSPTGLESDADGLPIFEYRATDATFLGGELEATWHILRPIESKGAAATAHTLDLTTRADYVFAEDSATDRSLPRITPFRAAVELAYSWRDRFTARVEGQWVARQDRTAESELPTDAYFLLGASVSCRVPIGATHCDFYVRGGNLTDDEARLHTSFLKEVAPLPGRSVLAGVRFEF